MKGTPYERLMANVTYEPNSGCWLFMGATCNPFGQCRIGLGKRGKKQVLVHRLAYSVLVGLIPAGKCVCHKCDVPCCVNPDHLFLGTHKDNMLDKERKGRGRQPKGEKHHKAKLTKINVIEIRRSTDSSQSLALQYGVTDRTINQVRSGKTWTHLERAKR